jgi:hypothetical protein
MKKNIFLVSAIALIAVFLSVGVTMAAPEQGLLVDKNGTPIKGYSNVYIHDGSAYPVYSADTNLWYTVFVIGKAPDGTVLCIIGHPLGVDSEKSYWEENENTEAPQVG